MRRKLLIHALILVVLAAATAAIAARRAEPPLVVEVHGNVTPENAVQLDTALQSEIHTAGRMKMVVTISDREIPTPRQ